MGLRTEWHAIPDISRRNISFIDWTLMKELIGYFVKKS
jgi:hypothetical protein